MSEIEQHVAGTDVAAPTKTPSPSSSASPGRDTKLPVSENSVYQALSHGNLLLGQFAK